MFHVGSVADPDFVSAAVKESICDQKDPKLLGEKQHNLSGGMQIKNGSAGPSRLQFLLTKHLSCSCFLEGHFARALSHRTRRFLLAQLEP